MKNRLNVIWEKHCIKFSIFLVSLLILELIALPFIVYQFGYHQGQNDLLEQQYEEATDMIFQQLNRQMSEISLERQMTASKQVYIGTSFFRGPPEIVPIEQ